jgi:hypothetical protein
LARFTERIAIKQIHNGLNADYLGFFIKKILQEKAVETTNQKEE